MWPASFAWTRTNSLIEVHEEKVAPSHDKEREKSDGVESFAQMESRVVRCVMKPIRDQFMGRGCDSRS
jgi:hypothetical protein